MQSENRLNRAMKNPVLLLLLPSLGLAAGYFLLTLRMQDTLVSRVFTQLPEFQLWRMFIMAQFAFMAGALGFLISQLRTVRQQRLEQGHAFMILLAIALPMILFWGPNLFGVKPDFPLAHHGFRIGILLAVAALVSALSIWGMQILFYDLKKLAQPCDTSDPVELEERVKQYLSRKRDVKMFLSILGLQLTLGILATGALSRAVLALDEDFFMTKDVVIAYGSYYTLLLAIVYLPLFVIEQAAARNIYDKVMGMVPGESATLAEKAETSEKVRGYLQIGMSAKQNLESTIPVLSPILAAIISGLLGK